jgi:hypothetical protein
MLIKSLSLLLLVLLIQGQAVADEYHRDGHKERKHRPHGEAREHLNIQINPRGIWYRGADIRHFHQRDFVRWRGGNWYQGPHIGVNAWWWIVDGHWYAYPRPFYPYPDPYRPAEVIVQQAPVEMVEQDPPTTASDSTQQAVQYWYYCAKPAGYYPYVAKCAGGWKKVPASPAAQ